MTTRSHFPVACRTGFALLLGTIGAAVRPPAAQAQAAAADPARLTLDAALREADRAAFPNRIAAATLAADQARAALPLKGILPALRVETGVIRTTDPIGAFGTLLRQRQVSPAAFDPARLNDPAPITNVQGGVVLEVPILNADAWTGRRAASAAAAASASSGAWTSVTIRTAVVRAFYGAVLAAEQVRALQAAERAASEAEREVQAMVQQGMVTRADALQANVHLLDVTAQRLSAQTDAQNAREQLSALLGRRDASLPVLPDALPADAIVRAMAARDTAQPRAAAPAGRADLRAAQEGLAAARLDRTRASSTLLPRVNSFARYDWFAPGAVFAGRPNWTLGVMATWSVFGGGSELADVEATRARVAAATAGHEAVLSQSATEGAAASRALVLALQRLDLATRAADQSREAQRLVQKRYAGGLATIAERLAADAGATSRTLAQSAARYAVITALAERRRAAGGDPADLRALDQER
jgi:outer membrane protein TolC